MEEQYSVEIIRSARKSIALQIKSDGSVVIRAPLRMKKADILSFLQSKEKWVTAHRSKALAREAAAAALPKLTSEEIAELASGAKKTIPSRVAFYAPLVGVSYGRITIRCQRTRWGSCSSKGNLNFNCLLMLAPPEVLDSVVVHELCHRKEMNHSQRFYGEVLRVFPDYRRWDRWLKENGRALMARLPDA